MPASALFVLISRMIRFLMQELLALAGLSRWSSLEGDCWRILFLATTALFLPYLSLFGTDILTWTDFLYFLGNPNSCKGSLLVHICSASTQALNVFKHSRLQIPWVWLKSNVGDRNGIKLQVSRAWTHSENKFQPGVLSDYTINDQFGGLAIQWKNLLQGG